MTVTITDFDGAIAQQQKTRDFSGEVFYDFPESVNEFVAESAIMTDIPRNVVLKFRAAAANNGEETVCAWYYSENARIAQFECESGHVYCVQY